MDRTIAFRLNYDKNNQFVSNKNELLTLTLSPVFSRRFSPNNASKKSLGNASQFSGPSHVGGERSMKQY